MSETPVYSGIYVISQKSPRRRGTMQKYGTDGLPTRVSWEGFFFSFRFSFFLWSLSFYLEFPVNSVSIDKDEN